MIRHLLSACVGAGLVVALAMPGRIAAKPPDLPEDGSFTAAPATSPPASIIEVLPMPHEDKEVTCPYLIQLETIHSGSSQPVDPEMDREVMENLRRLNRADHLLESAKELARAGFFAEAMECCACAAELCPGSPCASRAADTMLELALGIVPPTSGSEEAAEPPACPYCPSIGKPIREIVPEKKKSDAKGNTPSALDYEFEIGANLEDGLRMCADCSLGSNVYHVRYKHGCVTIWKTPDAGKTKP